MKQFFEIIKSIQIQKIRGDIAVIFVFLILALSYQQERLNYLIYDAFIGSINSSSKSHAVVLEVDDRSLAVLGEWPWNRGVHAELLEQLENYQVKAIGFDILFSENSHSTQEQDKLFAAAIAKSNNVVLPIAPSKSHLGGTPELLPQPELAANAAKIGHVDFELDEDGIIRQGFLYAGFQASRWPSFGLALAQVANKDLTTKPSNVTYGEGWTRREPILVNYNTPKGATRLEHYSYIDVLSGSVKSDKLKNKIILVGMNASAMGDQFATPISAVHETMPGVEINAHFVNTIMNNNDIKVLSNLQQSLLTLALLMLSAIIFVKVSAKQLFPTLMITMSVGLVLSALLFSQALVWYPPIILFISQVLLFSIANVIKNNLLTSRITSLKYDLNHDAITELLNLKGLHNLLASSLEENNDWLLVRLQVGKINGISELIGKTASEQLLIKIKHRLQQLLPEDAQGLTRIHSCEFAFFIPMLDDKRAIRLCEGIINALSKPYSVASENFKMPVNIGVSSSVFTSNGNELLAQAQAALERSQENILSSYSFYSSELKELIHERTQIESDLTLALENNEFEIHYQPQVNAKSSRIVGAEALMRWNHPTKGLISPAAFIPVAESTGMIIEIGRWVLQEACRQAAHWHSKGHKDFRVAVNLSPVQFSQPNLVQQVAEVLKLTGLEGEFLELELTESGILEDINGAIETFNALKKLGVVLSIDDFGTGYSSLSYLKKFPMDRIKIDRSFINEILDSKDSQEITLAIISMAHNLNMKVIAEGIESEQQHTFLYDNDCEELQGYYFGRPATVNELERLLKSH